MKYVIDHDYHIHSNLSYCSHDPLHVKENILDYAVKNNLKKIIITDHYWDSAIKNTHEFYDTQDYSNISKILPLPQSEGVEFKFGCETDMDTEMNIGIPKERYDDFHFIIVPTTHFNLFVTNNETLEERAEIYVKRFNKFLESDLPFHKVGLAHATVPGLSEDGFDKHIKIIEMISDKTFIDLFKGCKEKGCGVELNMPIFKYEKDDLNKILRPYIIAKDCGCKFYFGSDAHSLSDFDDSIQKFEYLVSLLNLTEEDKFIIGE